MNNELLYLHIEEHHLQFHKPAKTSRGEYTEKTVWVVSVSNKEIPGNLFNEDLVGEDWFNAYRHKKSTPLDTAHFLKLGYSEAAPLPDLSVDGQFDLGEVIKPWLHKGLRLSEILDLLQSFEPRSEKPFQAGLTNNTSYPTLRFAISSALESYLAGGTENWHINAFTQKNQGIKINGLVWMNEIEAMYEEAIQKIRSGFDCIKFKVGALDFDAECRLIEKIRKQYSEEKLEIRLDANGAFAEGDAIEKLNDLSRFGIHSIEQPIKAGSEFLEELCAKSKIAIALDEELIGLGMEAGIKVMKQCKPTFIIIKPTLLGGLDLSDIWIEEAEKLGIGWWSTSALEGNIGLYRIAHWVSNKNTQLPQGLGTGSLYKNNFPSFTHIKKDSLWKL